ncbi:MAG: hypothetical protein LUO80_02140 [Methylococcaceae bacterium]|nr:hypothetical protein [Methylococcaceae bacterium]
MSSTNPDILLKDSQIYIRSALERLDPIIEGKLDRTDPALAASERDLRKAADLIRRAMTPQDDIDFEIGETDV